MIAIRNLPAPRLRRNREGTRIRSGLVVSFGAALALLLSGCAGATGTTDQSATTSPPASNAESGIPSTAGSVITSEIVGYWHRAQTCEELLATFEAAGLAESRLGLNLRMYTVVLPASPASATMFITLGT